MPLLERRVRDLFKPRRNATAGFLSTRGNLNIEEHNPPSPPLPPPLSLDRLFHCDDLTFGNPIKLTVHYSGPPVEPNLFVLSPLLPDDWSEDVDDLPPEACLATDFQSAEGEMILNVKNGSIPLGISNAVRFNTSYAYVGFSNETIFSCEINDTFSNNEIIDRCADIHPEKADLNFFLLLMNGLRVVFTKAVAFNTILTVRTLLF
ncbi:hypothetical protein Q5P01_022970 [Channa striata]|uniref:Uncharacterized protein n=1 Tax=Channa striata TaxID=64152 RepID=A0AA88LRY2_CHASR|nr:hypothetical protein Q5P01_022970 [Channa striata]